MKRYVLPSLAAGLVLALAIPTSAAPRNKKKVHLKPAPNAVEAQAADYQALEQLVQVEGKLLAVPDDENLTLEVAYQSLLPQNNRKGENAKQMEQLLREEQQLQREQEQILTTTNPRQRQRRLEDLSRRMQRLETRRQQIHLRATTEHIDFDLPARAEVKVRTLDLPPKYDDKGNPSNYTPQELKDRKGSNPKLPGYESLWDNLQPGQMVRIYVAKPKKKPAAKEEDKEKKDSNPGEDKKDSKLDQILSTPDQPQGKDQANIEKPEITMVVILKEVPPKEKAK
ncbi:MAG: hypothetical protein JO112_08655 [Planctomycetes bacterium]|nr:hypothetical protein [Planctomycetota bacterium]